MHNDLSWLSWRRLHMLAIALIAAALPLVVGATAPAAFAKDQSRIWHVTVGVQTSNGAISGMVFTPSHIWVKHGDTVVWTVGSQEIHTVSFGTPPADTDDEGTEGISNPIANTLEELEEQFATPAGGTSFTGSGYYNSGLMTTVPAASGFPDALHTYALTINAGVGDYAFYCLVHGPMMSQTVSVIASTQRYPFTQEQYDQQAAMQRAQVFEQGWRAYTQTESTLPRNTVYLGSSVDSGQTDIMRFVRMNTTVKVNSWVTFTNNSMSPHTVTIGSEAALPFGGLVEYGDLSNVRLGENVSSGLFGAAFTGFGLPTSVQFRFTQPGVYHVFCIFHDYMGMVGTISVVP
ncbi:MAG: plastocyanin/azurin family copper-binding protein [Nitrososphaerota archaeon]